MTVSYSLFGIANDNPNAYKTEINSIHSKSIETVDELYSQEENYLKYINSSTNAKHTAYAYYQLALYFPTILNSRSLRRLLNIAKKHYHIRNHLWKKHNYINI